MAKITGTAAFSRRMDGLASGLGNLTTALLAAGRDVEETARNSLNDGAVSGPAHVPSAPGTPPNTDSHRLEASIHTEAERENKVLVIADTPYAAAQEFGNSRLPERPYMRPALAQNRDNIINRVKTAVNAAAAKR